MIFWGHRYFNERIKDTIQGNIIEQYLTDFFILTVRIHEHDGQHIVFAMYLLR